IMFPVIFTLTLERSTARAEATSGLLCTAIVGGAAIPYFAGLLSDAVGYGMALVLPAACYALLCIFAITAGRAPARQATAGATVH
ncbi:MAG TPA: MFS transporter, partial [Sphingopyxis sp.]|nr:MFS transporter [Sphingopyxis sp.]